MSITCLASQRETWRYESERRGRGLLLMVLVIPVPLVLPVWRDSVEFTFEGGHLIDLKSELTRTCDFDFTAPLDSVLFGQQREFSTCHVAEFRADTDLLRIANPMTYCENQSTTAH